MAIMGLETPVEMPSMNVYNTDLMKMYIAGLKDQYEKGREDFKDFMKLYLDFYSPIDGDTEAYNNMTIGGAGDMINQMLANGIDPFKNPEARAAISKYIYTRPVGTLNAMKQNAENRRLYDQAVAKARAEGKFDPAYEQWALQQAGLDNFRTVDPNTGLVRVWDRLGPDATQTMGDITVPYFEKFKQTEKLKSDQPGYIKYGVSDENQQKAIGAAMQHLEDTPWGKYLRYKADQQAAAMFPGATPEQLRAASDNILRELVSGIARQYFQPKYEVDEYARAEHLARLTARYSRSSGGGGGGNSNTKSGTSWFDTWWRATNLNLKGNSKTTVDGLRAYLSTQFDKNAKQGLRLTNLKANNILRKSGAQMDPLVIARLLGRKLNEDGTITLNAADMKRLKTPQEAVRGMGNLIPRQTGSLDFNTSAQYKAMDNAFARNEGVKLSTNQISVIVNDAGHARLVIPGNAVIGKSLSTGEYPVVLLTDLDGSISASGDFVPSDYTVGRLIVADQLGTDLYANQKNSTKIIE